MKTRLRKILSIILIVCFACSAFPINSSLAEGTDSVPESESSITFEDVLAGVATPSEYYDDWNSEMGEDPGSQAAAGGVQPLRW